MPKITQEQLPLIKIFRKSGLYPAKLKEFEDNLRDFGVEGITNEKSLEKIRKDYAESRLKKAVKTGAGKVRGIVGSIADKADNWLAENDGSFDKLISMVPTLIAGGVGTALGGPAGGLAGAGIVNEGLRKIDPDLEKNQPDLFKTLSRMGLVFGLSKFAKDGISKLISKVGGTENLINGTNEAYKVIEGNPEVNNNMDAGNIQQQPPQFQEQGALNQLSNLGQENIPGQVIQQVQNNIPSRGMNALNTVTNALSTGYNAFNPKANPKDPNSERKYSPLEVGAGAAAGGQMIYDAIRGNKPPQQTYEQLSKEDPSTLAYRQKIRDMVIPEIERMNEYNRNSYLHNLLTSLNPYKAQ